MSKLHAWWSDKMAKNIPHTSIYATPDGREIEVCQVTETPDHGTKWPDMVYLGNVTCWLRVGTATTIRGRIDLTSPQPQTGEAR